MKLLQAMSLAGSIAMAGYFIMKRIFKNTFSYTFYKNILVLAMFFFLTPFQEWKYRYQDMLEALLPVRGRFREALFTGIKQGVPIKNVIYYTEEGGFYAVKWYWYLCSMICFLALFAFVCWQMRQNRVIRRKLVEGWERPEEQCLEHYCRKWGKRLKLHRKVELRESGAVGSPVTMGTFRPVIVIPKAGEREGKEADMELALLHELVHIQRWDTLFSMLCAAVVALHFFNPFAYFLYFEWRRARELFCDEKVLFYAGEDKLQKYGKTIIHFAQKDVLKSRGLAGFSRQPLMKERIVNMKTKRNNKWYRKALAAALMAGTAFLSSLSVFAYQPDIWHRVDEITPVMDVEDVYFNEEQFFLAEAAWHEVELGGRMVSFPFLGHEQEILYLDENGEAVVEEYEEPSAEARAKCEHAYTEGYRRHHKADGSGGCTVKIYKVSYCLKCGIVTGETLYNVETYEICHH